MATISVIIPVYNTAPYLRECVDSVISQTFADTQIILVDDGSDDGSAGICDEYADRFDNVSVIHKSNGGLSEARNVGMAASHGEYTFFLDSDDRIVPDTLETLLGLLNGYDADIATARHIYWYDNAAVPAESSCPPAAAGAVQWRSSIPLHPGPYGCGSHSCKMSVSWHHFFL